MPDCLEDVYSTISAKYSGTKGNVVYYKRMRRALALWHGRKEEALAKREERRIEMKKILDVLTEEMGKAFEAAGYEAALGRVTLSNRPDLCEYQCNGAMAGAKKYKKAPIMIANDVAARLADSPVFKEAAEIGRAHV